MKKLISNGNFLSFMVILAPVPTFYRVYKKKSTESFHSAPYIVALLSAMVWLYYAILTRDVFLLTINGGACVMETIYLVIYLTYAPKNAMVLTLKIISMLNIACYSCLVFFTFYFSDGKRRVEIAGWISSSLAVFVFIAPLSIIKQVIKTRSVEYMPFTLSLSLTLSAVVWFCYGLLKKDTFVAVPNVMGFMFGVAQMILYFIYKAVSAKNGTSISQVIDLEKVDDQGIQISHIMDLEKDQDSSISQLMDSEKDQAANANISAEIEMKKSKDREDDKEPEI
ncbi:hypothetical protein LUZ60_013973 [Juncus effusus]|nr:hypothetical protein LUZ60_013973 [Juncus effusus]